MTKMLNAPARWSASTLAGYGRLHRAMCSAVDTIPKGLKQINEHCVSFLFVMTYYNSEKINIAEKEKTI